MKLNNKHGVFLPQMCYLVEVHMKSIIIKYI